MTIKYEVAQAVSNPEDSKQIPEQQNTTENFATVSETNMSEKEFSMLDLEQNQVDEEGMDSLGEEDDALTADVDATEVDMKPKIVIVCRNDEDDDADDHDETVSNTEIKVQLSV